ncbi:MAG: WYL domain-containing protein [Lachnospiraceae bacterium]|nr:WYL domain-containing protein [Lachnospiraceae bacterium]
MYGTERKKALIIKILNILKDYSDEEHPLTQQRILKLLEEVYDTTCDRRSVGANIADLIEMGYDIVSAGSNKGYFLASREFESAEIRMLIDSVLFSRNVTKKQAKDLIAKLKKLGNRYFDAKVSHISGLSEKQYASNRQIIYNLDLLNEAIEQKKKVSFVYNRYGTDLKLHPRKEEPFVMNPYHIVACNGRYYLIGNVDKYDNVAHYRIDRMTEVALLSEAVKPMKQVRGLENGLDLPKHMAEHIYMFNGESVSVSFKISPELLDDVVDWFGRDITLTSRENGELTVYVKCNERAFFYWALQYGEYVEAVSPASLRESLITASERLYRKYHSKG